jgi:hypothetical protein
MSAVLTTREGGEQAVCRPESEHGQREERVIYLFRLRNLAAPPSIKPAKMPSAKPRVGTFCGGAGDGGTGLRVTVIWAVDEAAPFKSEVTAQRHECQHIRQAGRRKRRIGGELLRREIDLTRSGAEGRSQVQA